MAQAAELDLDKQKPAGKKHIVLYVIIGGLVLALAAVGSMLMAIQAEKAEESEVVVKDARYLLIDTLVGNFAARGAARFIQVDMQFMTYEPQVLEVLKSHMPVIRNDLLLLLSGQDQVMLRTQEGKERLRTQIKETVQAFLEAQGEEGVIENVYFTSFVMQ